MKKMHDTPHQFALYVPDLFLLVKDARPNYSFNLADAALVHRIITILRLQADDTIILFDQKVQCLVTLNLLVKNKLVKVSLQEKKLNIPLKPAITFIMPLLKKESLESALYSLTEIGVNRIQLVITTKSQQRWTDKEHERAGKIIVAAAEQSKNFAFPELLAPVKLADAIAQIENSAAKLFFDPTGIPLSLALEKVASSISSGLILAIGPEGDLTPAEKETLSRARFILSALTPTILRACQAAALSAGIIRSVIS